MKTEAEIKDTLALVTRSQKRATDLVLVAAAAGVIDVLNWVIDNPTNLTSLIDGLKICDAIANAEDKAERQ